VPLSATKSKQRKVGLANVLCAIADHSQQSGQPSTKHLIVEVTPAVNGPAT
jgi:hypothetical protein